VKVSGVTETKPRGIGSLFSQKTDAAVSPMDAPRLEYMGCRLYPAPV